MTNLLECASCGFRFFEERYDDAEAGRLYEGYRGERYFRERHRFEWWYSRKANAGIGNDARNIESRKRRVEAYLKAQLDLAGVARVLDYGGDRGQFIPDGAGKERYVLEISSEKPVPGVVGVQDVSEIPGPAKSMDLVLLCHVLEHCSEPLEVLSKARGLLADGGRLYVELPHERYGLGWCRESRLYRAYLGALARSGRLLGVVDFFSTAVRLKARFVPPLGFMKLHEHINFFDEDSLRSLLRAGGFQVVDCRVAPPDRDAQGLREPLLLCLARRA